MFPSLFNRRITRSLLRDRLLLVALALLSAVPGTRAEAPAVAPLFPIALDTPLKDSRALVAEVRDLILENYYTPAVSPEILDWAAIQGMLRHISPPESPELATLWTPDAYARVEAALKGRQSSFGLKSRFDSGDGSLTVTEVLPDSPADGRLQTRDRIMRINAVELRGLNADQVSALFDVPQGERLELTVVRDIEVLTVALTRESFTVRNLLVHRVADDITWIELRRFSAGIAEQLAAAVEPRGGAVILDLRHNNGGVLREALQAAELFLPAGAVVLRTVQRGVPQKRYVSGNATPVDRPLVVLTDRVTASAAEVLVAALQGNRRALVVGGATYGKGVFERTFTLSHGYRVKFITGAMYSPAGSGWQSRGIAPDIRLDQEDRRFLQLRRLPPARRLQADPLVQVAVNLIACGLDARPAVSD